MSRITFAAGVLNKLDVHSVLDVGCRSGDLADHLRDGVKYAGADLFADTRGRVRYVGDISKLDIPDRYDAVVALDVLEHLETPSSTLDKLVACANRYVFVSLPNCYDLKSRVRFVAGGQLGGKYRFDADEPMDRHRWLMNRSEIVGFFESKARRHAMDVEIMDVTYGASGEATASARAGRVLSSLFPPSLTAETVCALFRKRG